MSSPTISKPLSREQDPARRLGHSFIPTASYMSSPTSSTGSASILDWNSNSDGGEIFRLSPPIGAASMGGLQRHASSGPGPVIYDFNSIPSSPSSLGQSNVEEPHETAPQSSDPRLGTMTALDSDPFLAQWEITAMPDPFSGLMPPAPVSDDIADAVAGTLPVLSTEADVERPAPVDDRTPLSVLAERLSLQDMVKEWNAGVRQEEDSNTGSSSKVKDSVTPPESAGDASMTTVTPSPPTPISFPNSLTDRCVSDANNFTLPADETESPYPCPGLRPLSPTESEQSYDTRPYAVNPIRYNTSMSQRHFWERNDGETNLPAFPAIRSNSPTNSNLSYASTSQHPSLIQAGVSSQASSGPFVNLETHDTDLIDLSNPQAHEQAVYGANRLRFNHWSPMEDGGAFSSSTSDTGNMRSHIHSESEESVIIDIPQPPLPTCFLSRHSFGSSNQSSRNTYPRHSLDLLPVDVDGNGASARKEDSAPQWSVISRSDTTGSPAPYCGLRDPHTSDDGLSRTPSEGTFMCESPLETPEERVANHIPGPSVIQRIWSNQTVPGANESSDMPAPSWLPPTVSTGTLPSLVDNAEVRSISFTSATGCQVMPTLPARASPVVIRRPSISSPLVSTTSKYQGDPGMVTEMPSIPSWLKACNTLAQPATDTNTFNSISNGSNSTVSSTSTKADDGTKTIPSATRRPPLPPIPKQRTPELSLRPDGIRPLGASLNSYARVHPTAWGQSRRSSSPCQITVESSPFADSLPTGPLLVSPGLRSTNATKNHVRWAPQSACYYRSLPTPPSPISPVTPNRAVSPPPTRTVTPPSPFIPEITSPYLSSYGSPYTVTRDFPRISDYPSTSSPPMQSGTDLPAPARFELFDSPIASRNSTPSPPVPAVSPLPPSPPLPSTNDNATEVSSSQPRTQTRTEPAFTYTNPAIPSIAPIPQRRLRFAPLPSTPGSSLRTSAFSPYSYACLPPPQPPQMPAPLPPPSAFTSGFGYSTPYMYQTPPGGPLLRTPAISSSGIGPWVSPRAPGASRPWYGQPLDSWYRPERSFTSSLVSPPGMYMPGPQLSAMASTTLPPLPSGIGAARAHPVFWFSDATVTFRVEDCLFKVHRYFFEKHSEHFRILLASRPAPIGVSPHSAPYFLTDIKKVEFEKLLYTFYPSSLIDPDLVTVEDWSCVLSLANKWNMADLKALAVQKLTPIASSVDKIAIAKKYNMVGHQWLLPAYADLCSRNVPLALAEAEKLDMQTVLKIWEVQHQITNWPGMYYPPSIEQMVKEKFGLA